MAAIALLGLLGSIGPARAAGEPPEAVAELRVEGNQRLTTAAVLASVKTRVGQTYDERIIRDDKQRLLQTGRFKSVVVTRTRTPQGFVITFVVVERPLVAGLSFEGNKAFKDKKLAGALLFGASDPLSAHTVEAGRQAILGKYRSGGYHFATVTVDRAALEKDQRVVYRIVEGPRVRIRRIKFRGRRYFTAWRLKREIGSSAKFWPFVSGNLDVEQIEQDVQVIRNLYVSEGFLDAQVDRRLDFSGNKKWVTLTFVIETGQRYRVNRVIFEGNKVFSDEELARRLKLGQGEFFTTLSLRRDIQTLQETYGELGYIDAGVQPRKQYVDPTAQPPAWARGVDGGKPALLNMVFQVVEADQYTIGRVIVRGNTVTKERIIRREMRFYPEQLFNTVAVAESRHRLIETRLFEKVDITPAGRAAGVRDVLVQVSEGRTAEFLVGVGISTNSGLLGNVTFTQRNFDVTAWPTSWRQIAEGRAWKGAAQIFRIVAEPGMDMMRFHIEWVEPKLFDHPYRLAVRAFLFERGRESYDETRYGGLVSLGHRFKNRWYGELATRIEGIEIGNLENDYRVPDPNNPGSFLWFPGAPPEVRQDAGTNVILGIQGMLVRDRTDSRWMPSTGDRIHFSYEEVVGDFNFGRAVGEYRIYRTVHLDALDRKHILAGRFSVGNIFGDAPVVERWYGGGLGSIRGFDYRGISPRSRARAFDDPIGGEFMVYAGTEYTFPLFGNQLRGVVFLDTGSVEESFQITTYRVSMGVGLRWIVPMLGPIPMSLDFGVPISKHTDDDTQLLSFSFGWTF